MANYSITVSSSFNLLGGGRTNRWGDSAVSGTTLVFQSAGLSTFNNVWGAQTDFELQMTKFIGNTMAFATDPQKAVTKEVTNSLDFSSTVGKRVSRQIDNEMGLASTMVTLTKQNRDWDYVYPDNTINAVGREITDYSSVTAGTTTWTDQSYTTTSWTEV